MAARRSTVHYFKSVTRKPRPGIITGTALDGGKIIRVGHTGEVYGNATVGVPARTSHSQTNVFVYY